MQELENLINDLEDRHLKEQGKLEYLEQQGRLSKTQTIDKYVIENEIHLLVSFILKLKSIKDATKTTTAINRM